MAAIKEYTKGDGVFVVRGNMIHVHGTINGQFYRKSTGKKYSPRTKTWMKKADPLKFLVGILGISEVETEADLEAFGYSVLNLTTANVSRKHKEDVLGVFKNHILPAFKHVGMKDIKPIDVISFLESLKDNLSYTRVRFIRNTFSLILEHALDNMLINKNPFNAQTVKKVDLIWDVSTEVYTTEETAKILKNAAGWLRVFLDISFTAGIRTGEAMVLKWGDFDLDNGILYLKRSLSNDGIIVEHVDKKNKGKRENKDHFRSIPLFSSTIKLLKSYFEVRPNRTWLFVSKDHKPFTKSQSIADYHLKPFLKEIGVKYKTLYATRRSYASIMKYAGEDLDDLQEVMGHSKGSSVTEKHYITEDILSIKDKQKQANHREKLFNILLDQNKEPED